MSLNTERWNYSKWSLVIIGLSLFIASFFYYPKWSKTKTEATISWDVSGYYQYLPSAFIYKDLKKMGFFPGILEKYHPTTDYQQAYQIPNGNYVCKYSSGMALQYLPAFMIGHLSAKLSEYPADGYSLPYQLSLHSYSFFIALLGLYLWLLFLRRYFSDQVTAVTLVFICLGSNYLTYSGITNAMSHNYLLFNYAALLLLSDNFYKNPKWRYALAIGLVTGTMALTRPTELAAVLIPIFWRFSWAQKSEHFTFLKTNLLTIITAGIICGSIGFIQLCYWKYVSGSWIQYSYDDQGFSFLSPHILEGLFHINNGWLTYSPMMVFSLIGFYFLFKSKLAFRTIIIVYALLFIYIAFSWDVWWYGGSVGQRTMVQLTPILSIAFASFIDKLIPKPSYKVAMLVVGSLFIYYNLWITHQAHRGEYYLTERMSKKFLLHSIGKNKISKASFNLLDKAYYFDGFRKDVTPVYSFNSNEIADSLRIYLNKDVQYSPEFQTDITERTFEWIRIKGQVDQKMEWNFWRHTQLNVELFHDKNSVKKKQIRINKFFDKDGVKSFHLDIPKPSKPIDYIKVFFFHSESENPMEIKKLTIETFNS